MSAFYLKLMYLVAAGRIKLSRVRLSLTLKGFIRHGVRIILGHLLFIKD